MTKNPFARAVPAALLAAVLSASAMTVPALADVKDYRFELVQQEAKVGEAVVAVRLVDKRSGKAVPDAVIFAKRLDMAPDSMEEMVTKLEQVPSTEPGVYRFKAKLSMAGGWRLSLGAKVQGETGTVEDKLVFQAVK
ncbi:YtkA-like [Methylobacterium sp. 174MFSha1.1]|uniref:FixH family protein n=1 Tax=Methylobacterium sp. 174MFSha1.1 TaxID=1502749 RepID=UPI0008E0500F|nr:FixH family protein [Methylobacterium sp. 174MFSha1.1]SFU35133.1 YtkA-like [Methylobacterium sp. 174MFSha1.1]